MVNQISEDFIFKSWTKVCKQNEKKLLLAWLPHSDSEYTVAILKVLDSLKKEFQVNDEDWELHNEYYKCDAVYYDKKDSITLPKLSMFKKKGGVFLRHILVHLEHENEIRTSWEEIFQFCAFSADLNVLVTYPKSEKDIETLKTEYAKILSTVDFYPKKLLIILGIKIENPEKIKWFGFKCIEDNELEEITENEVSL